MVKGDFIGKWRIKEMSTWEKDYFDEEAPAYFKIEKNLMGDFHFGYVQGRMDGRIIRRPDGEYFEFTFDGNDECDSAFGNGWIKIKDKNNAVGEIRFHFGDDSEFQIKRMKQ